MQARLWVQNGRSWYCALGWNVSKNTKKRIAWVVFEIKGLILVSLCGFKKLLFDFSLIFLGLAKAQRRGF